MTTPVPRRVCLFTFTGLLALLMLASGCGGADPKPGGPNDGAKDGQAGADKAADKREDAEPRDRKGRDQVEKPDQAEKQDGQDKVKKKEAGKPKQEQPKQPPEMKPVQHWTFENVPDNKLPEGWLQQMGAIRVKDKLGRRALELIGDSGGTAVEPPPVMLGDPFFLELEVELPHKDANITMQLLGKGKFPLIVFYNGDSSVVIHSSLRRDHSEHWKAGGINKIRLERRGDQYTVKMNGVQVESEKMPNLKDDFNRIVLGLYRKFPNDGPRVHAVTIGQ